ncbi:unnamed protein product [Clonostachys chloroleuca]|uniref:Uncharacterized protein n=1 Tax=Clonostachys chloroleuca TaxID=1926264 RepID=A0AA35VJY6_9HYPO|nr:unnamed protein product [Clonostachys chloroleuca]
MMSRKLYYETDSCGKGQFVKLKRSRSHGHKHHRHHHHHIVHDDIPQEYVGHEYFMIKPEDWRVMKERDRILTDNNESLTKENGDLRTSLSAAQADLRQLNDVVVPDLRCQISALQAENQALRCSLENSGEHHHELDRLRCRITVLEKENKEVLETNADLRSRVRELSRQLDQNSNRRISELNTEVEYWGERARYWRGKFEDLDKKYHRLRNKGTCRVEKVDTYEDFWRRHYYI